MLRLPPGRLEERNESKPHRRGISYNLRHLPHDDRLDQHQFQSRSLCQLSLDWRTFNADLHAMPCKQQLHKHADSLLLMPSSRFQWNYESQSCGLGIPDRLFDLSLDKRLDSFVLQPQQHFISAHWGSHYAGVLAVPHKQQLHDAADNMLRLPSIRLEWNHQSQPCRRWISNYLRHLP